MRFKYMFISTLFILCLLSLIAVNAIADEGKDRGKAMGNLLNQKYKSKTKIKNNVTKPITGVNQFTTVDGSETFDGQLMCPSSEKAILLQYLPLGNNEYQVYLKQDMDMNGEYEHTYNTPRISGICSNGIVSCSPGTWENCQHYAWVTNEDGSARLTTIINGDPVDARNYGNCECSNVSCNRTSFDESLFTQIGGSVASVIMNDHPDFILADTEFDMLTFTLNLFGQSQKACTAIGATDYTEMGVQDPKNYYEQKISASGAGSTVMVHQSTEDNSNFNMMMGITTADYGDGMNMGMPPEFSCSITNTVHIAPEPIHNYQCENPVFDTDGWYCVRAYKNFSDFEYWNWRITDDRNDIVIHHLITMAGWGYELTQGSQADGQTWHHKQLEVHNIAGTYPDVVRNLLGHGNIVFKWQANRWNDSDNDVMKVAAVDHSFYNNGDFTNISGNFNAIHGWQPIFTYSVPIEDLNSSHDYNINIMGTDTDEGDAQKFQIRLLSTYDIEEEALAVTTSNDCGDYDSCYQVEEQICDNVGNNCIITMREGNRLNNPVRINEDGSETVLSYAHQNCYQFVGMYRTYLICSNGSEIKQTNDDYGETVLLSSSEGMAWPKIKKKFLCEENEIDIDLDGIKQTFDTADFDGTQITYENQMGEADEINNIPTGDTCSISVCTVKFDIINTEEYADETTSNSSFEPVMEVRNCTDNSGIKECPVDTVAGEMMIEACSCDTGNQSTGAASAITQIQVIEQASKGIMCSTTPP